MLSKDPFQHFVRFHRSNTGVRVKFECFKWPKSIKSVYRCIYKRSLLVLSIFQSAGSITGDVVKTRILAFCTISRITDGVLIIRRSPILLDGVEQQPDLMSRNFQIRSYFNNKDIAAQTWVFVSNLVFFQSLHPYHTNTEY